MTLQSPFTAPTRRRRGLSHDHTSPAPLHLAAVLAMFICATAQAGSPTSALAYAPPDAPLSITASTLTTPSALSFTQSLAAARITHALPASPGGTVAGQGAAAIKADQVRSQLGVDGAGITIGVISDSFNTLGGMNAGVSSGNLPGPGNPAGYLNPIHILRDDATPGVIDEGRAMAEIIHDVAPGARILFHSAFNNTISSLAPPDQTIADAVDALVAAGADIIVDDVGIVTTSVYQDGAAAHAVDRARNAGVAYYSSAGNLGTSAYEAAFTGQIAGYHQFDANGNEAAYGGDQLFNVVIPALASSMLTLSWTDPYRTIGGQPETDFALELHTGDGLLYTADADQLHDTADPYEFVYVSNSGADNVTIGLAIRHVEGPTKNKRVRLQAYNAPIADDDVTNSPTVFGHAASLNAVAVAAQVFDPLAAGNDPHDVEWFSSHGPVVIRYDRQGNPILETRPGPQLTAPDGVNTSFFGQDTAVDADSLPNFYGTSAAAPHVAAAAALVIQHADDLGIQLNVDQLNQILFDTAHDLTTPGLGFDDASGFGLVDALAAVLALDAIDTGFSRIRAITIEDLELLQLAIRQQDPDPRFDVDQQPGLSNDDYAYFLAQLAHFLPGDTDGDYDVDQRDIDRILAAGYFGADAHTALWSDGDFDNDGDVDNDDVFLILDAGAFNKGVYYQPSQTTLAHGAINMTTGDIPSTHAQTTIPEPLAIVFWLGIIIPHAASRPLHRPPTPST